MSNDLDKTLMAVGLGLWRESYGAGRGEEELKRIIERRVREMGSPQTEVSDHARLLTWTKWIHGGCVTLTTSHRFGAALCASRAAEGVLDDVELPSKCFRIDVPNGLLLSEAHETEFTRVWICVLDDGQTAFALEGTGPSFRNAYALLWCGDLEGQPTFATELLNDSDPPMMSFGEGAEAQHSLSEIEVRKRLLALAKRLTVGLLLAYTHTTNWRDKSFPAKEGGRRRRNAPAHRNIFIGKPLSVDVRPALRAWLGSRSRQAIPSVQTLVRGHHKRQVVGVARSGRKVIWVEPYWRGPEEAPILSRPLRIGGASS